MTQSDPFRNTVTCGGLEGARVIRRYEMKLRASENNGSKQQSVGRVNFDPKSFPSSWLCGCFCVCELCKQRLVWLNTACQASAADRAYLNRRSTVCSCSLVRSPPFPLFPLALPPFPYSVQTPVNICVSSQSNSFRLTFLGEFKPLSSDIYSTVLCKSLESPLSCHFFF